MGRTGAEPAAGPRSPGRPGAAPPAGRSAPPAGEVALLRQSSAASLTPGSRLNADPAITRPHPRGARGCAQSEEWVSFLATSGNAGVRAEDAVSYPANQGDTSPKRPWECP